MFSLVSSRFHLWFIFMLLLASLFLLSPLMAQEQVNEEALPDNGGKEVAVEKVTPDEKIAKRLQHILEASHWFDNVQVRVESGLVFLSGVALSEERKNWASNLSSNVEGAVAVINHMTVVKTPIWSLRPIMSDLETLTQDAHRLVPVLFLSLLLFGVTYYASSRTRSVVYRLLGKSSLSVLLRSVLSRLAAGLIFLLGLSLVLRSLGLTNIAFTLLGSTGLIGITIGFAFRDIAENFLASLLLSVQRPFNRDDYIRVSGHEGFVIGVNMRSTVLMTRDGNHVQIPNAIVYKEVIENHTANPNMRLSFQVGIGYDASVANAQTLILSVLAEHSAVLDDPESLILVEELGAATVNLNVLFWVNVKKYSFQKVRSSVIRLVKARLIQAGISLPDEARELVFPQGVPVKLVKEGLESEIEKGREEVTQESEQNSQNKAEGEMTAELDEIIEQAKHSQLPEQGEDLLQK